MSTGSSVRLKKDGQEVKLWSFEVAVGKSKKSKLFGCYGDVHNSVNISSFLILIVDRESELNFNKEIIKQHCLEGFCHETIFIFVFCIEIR